MAREKVNLEEREKQILWFLHQAIVDEKSCVHKMGQISEENEIPIRIVELCTKKLEEDGYCDISEEEIWDDHPMTGKMYSYQETFVTITMEGIKEVESWPNDVHDNVVTGLFSGRVGVEYDHYLAHNPDALEFESGVIPASDRMVNLNHNSAEYKEAISLYDSLVEKIRGDNEYGAQAPEEKESILQALGAGRKLLDAIRFRVVAAKATLLPPLNFIAKNFTKGAIGTLAGTAMRAVLKILGLG